MREPGIEPFSRYDLWKLSHPPDPVWPPGDDDYDYGDDEGEGDEDRWDDEEEDE